MTNFAEKKRMDLAFNKILKEEISSVIPMIRELMEAEISEEVLRGRLLDMLDQNYECFGIYLGQELIGVFGLWFMTRHYAGKSCEPDHIFIKERYRGTGVGKKLFTFIYEYASERGCETTELNSYVHNYRSHKFYLNEGYVIKGYHFLKKL